MNDEQIPDMLKPYSDDVKKAMEVAEKVEIKDTSHKTPCISYVVKSWGTAHPSCIYLRDATKITVGRDKTTTGPAWLEISKQDSITTA